MNCYLDMFLENNFGDDLFLKIILERYPNVDFYIELSDPKRYVTFFEKYSNLHIIKKNKYISYGIRKLPNNVYERYIRNIYQRYNINMWIILGGSMFIENKEFWKEQLRIRLLKQKYFKSNNLPMFVLGANFGEVKTEHFVQEYNDFFSEFTDVCFRDEKSKEYFPDNKIVRNTTDIVFLTDSLIENKKASNVIGISVINPYQRKFSSGQINNYKNHLTQYIIEASKDDKVIKLFSFCTVQGDSIFVEELIDNLSKYNVKIIKSVYKDNIEETLDELLECSLIICSRYHAMVLAINSNIPFFTIGYDQKSFNLVKDLGLEEYYSDFDNIDNISYAFIKSLSLKYNYSFPELKKYAESQFEELDNLVHY